MEQKPEQNNSSLEAVDPLQDSSLETPVSEMGSDKNPDAIDPKRPSIKQKVRSGLNRFNIYLLGFVLLIILSVIATIVAIQLNRQDTENNQFDIQTLDEEALEALANNSTTVGDPKQTLNIESNAIFSGSVLVRSSLDVAGTIRVGGELSLPGITVSGTSSFDQVQINSLAISGNTSVQGQLVVQQNLTVSGTASFGGAISAPQLNIDTLRLNGDLQLNRHIDAGGVTPGKSDGTALGTGGTSSVSGTDTAGTININTGGGPVAGCFVTITFAQAFNGTPHVVVTPIGSSAAGLNYYVNRSTSSFSLCTTNAAPASATFSFDYIVMD